MISSDVLWTYILAVIVIVSIPGPNIILIINDSMGYGLKKSMMTILGIKAGTSLLFLISLSGLTALLTFFSSLFLIIKWCGVCYLVYLGVSQILSSFAPDAEGPAQVPHRNNFFVKGFLESATNPKGLLFAGAFFPQFVDTQQAVGPQVFLLGSLFLLISFCIEFGFAQAGTATGRLFETRAFKRIADRISGTLLIIFGAGLAFVKRES